MREKQPLEVQRLMGCLSSEYGIEVAALTPLALGADINASVYKALAHDKCSYFVKLKRGHDHAMSATLSTLLYEAGIEQIIPPIKTIHGQLIQPIGDFTLLVYPFVEGQDGFSQDLTDEQWVILGRVLRQVHEFKTPPAVQEKIKQEGYSSKWQEMVRSLLIHIEKELGGDEIALKLLMFMREHKAEIQRLVDRAGQLGQKIQRQSPQFVLCHSDIHGGNVLIDRNGALYIVDWDEPIMAPKERDLMFIGGGVANVWNDPQGAASFYQGYGKSEVNGEILTYYRHERIVEDIALYGEQLLLMTGKDEERQEMYKQFVEMFAHRGVVEIAFKTDESLGTSSSRGAS